MKKSMVAGSIAGVGLAFMVIAGMRTQGFDWNDVMFIVGSMGVTFGGIHLAQIMEEMLNEKADNDNRSSNADMDDPILRPFNLSGSESRRA